MKRLLIVFPVVAAVFLFSRVALALDPIALPVDRACVVVLDPGHGGEDTGATGPAGVNEKDVTLAVAKKTAELIKAKTLCDVTLTRADDTFVPLAKRVAVANALNADLFVSIPVNAARRKAATGVETFFLSVDATDAEAQRLADFENSAGAMKNPSVTSDDLNDILLDLVITGAHHESARLAEAVQTSLLAGGGSPDRGVKQAPFIVLNGAAMPAALVEIGFISNKADEKRLKQEAEQTRIAQSLYNGIEVFLKTSAQLAKGAK
ncbi:MAG: N-acetylmuramoyl-L-alanine amidase [Deltaproteobacteria bacterium]|nr:N-acetylmuramoyl-L-alanine amidase [Deltaproteobacteria bacterium]